MGGYCKRSEKAARDEKLAEMLQEILLRWNSVFRMFRTIIRCSIDFTMLGVNLKCCDNENAKGMLAL
jgi:hypothetical protein